MNTGNTSLDAGEEDKLTRRLINLSICCLILALGRIIAGEIMLCISDILTAVMIYFYSQSKTKCMAIFCMINGVIGIIYSLAKFLPAWKLAKENWFHLYQTLLVVIALYAIIVYLIICYFSFVGIRKYEMGLALPGGYDGNRNVSSNYGAITSPEQNYKPFSGKGVTLG